MRNIGKPTLHFRAPALIEGRLTYLGSKQFAGRWTALCFLPYVGIVEPGFIDRQADGLGGLETTLLIVSSGARPLHRVWMDRPTRPRTPLLYDPLNRLHRTFGVDPLRTPVRCQTFVIDRAGVLHFHLIHDFTDRGLCAVQEIVLLSQARSADRTPMDHSENNLGPDSLALTGRGRETVPA